LTPELPMFHFSNRMSVFIFWTIWCASLSAQPLLQCWYELPLKISLETPQR